MKFTSDWRFTAMQILKTIVGYIISISFVLCVLKPADQLGSIGSILAFCVVMFFVYFFPRSIYINDGIVSFVRDNSYGRCKVALSEITKVEQKPGLYNTLELTTESGIVYRLHPSKINEFMQMISCG